MGFFFVQTFFWTTRELELLSQKQKTMELLVFLELSAPE
jgi:hypothetical protein